MAASEELSPFLLSKNDHSTNIQKDDTVTFNKTSWRCWGTLIKIALVCFVVAAIFSAGILVGHFAVPSTSTKSCGSSSNGPSNITEEICSDPPLLLVSLDGFRAHYFSLNVTPNLHDFYTSGVRAKFMRSSFPTKTFPNHYSIVTGLYPESHGIVNNVFYDSKLKDSFHYNSRLSLQSKWWGGEPVWVTASLNDLRTASYFWPGSEAAIKGIRPDVFMNYDGSIPFSLRVEGVLDWLNQPKEKRPKFITLYFSEPDHLGHGYGPESSEITIALRQVDGVMRLLMTELGKRNISDCVNIVVVSDHGMAAFNSSDFIDFNQLFSKSLRSKIGSLPTGVISNPVRINDSYTDMVYQAFLNGTIDGYPFRVFPREKMPLRLHSGLINKQRYGPWYAIADVHAGFDFGSFRGPIGNHGYDNIEKEMQAIFLARGPYFKKNYVSEGFENVQVYSLLCDLLNITPAANNGSYGSLHHLLDPSYASKLNASKSFPPTPGTLGQCSFPTTKEELIRRSNCTDCVCRTSECNVSDDDILSANEFLFNITDDDKEDYKKYHHPWGVPQGGYGDGACVLSQQAYVTLYSQSLNTPLWAGYTLDPQLVDGNHSLDHWCWRSDPRLPFSSYSNCTADLWRKKDNSTYVSAPLLFPMDSNTNISLSMSVLTNVVYMERSFSDGIWTQVVMQRIRAWLKIYGVPLNVIMGVIMDDNGVEDIDLPVPSDFYIIVSRCTKTGTSLQSCAVEDLAVLGLVLQQPRQAGDYEDDEKLLQYSVTPVRDIERATGVNFFPNLPPADQNTLELALQDELWPHTVQ